MIIIHLELKQITSKRFRKINSYQSNHCEVQTDHIEENPEEVTQFKNAMADNQNSCDSCGLLFDTPHDVQRHIKRGWCAESNDEPPAKRKKKKKKKKKKKNQTKIAIMI